MFSFKSYPMVVLFNSLFEASGKGIFYESYFREKLYKYSWNNFGMYVKFSFG